MTLRSAYRRLPLLPLALGASACLTPMGMDGGGEHYGRIRGTVTRATGTPVANAPIGVSCVGATNEPFGLTTDADAAGRFDVDVNAPSLFAPLPGPSYVCRVLTPYVGIPQVEKSIVLTVSATIQARPVTELALVVP